MKKFTIIAAVLTAAGIATSAAAAEGEYYQGIDRHSNNNAQSSPSSAILDQSRTFFFPRSEASKVPQTTVDSGDYYPGASRPN